MMRESLFYKILSVIHIVFFTSILCFGTIYLTGTILMMPAFGAAFKIGKDFLYKDLDITDSIVKTYFKYLKSSMKLIKYFPVNLAVALNAAGMLAAAKAKLMVYSVICLIIISFILAFAMYLAGYHVFVDEKVNATEAAFCMFFKPLLFIPVFIVMVLCVCFFSVPLLSVLFFCGTFFLFAVEVIIFIQTLYYRNLTGKLDEGEEFAYLIKRKKK